MSPYLVVLPRRVCHNTHMSKSTRLAEMLNSPRDTRHGTATGYVTGCRCARCREANAARLRRYRRSGPSPTTHGTETGYVRGCRCSLCSKAGKAAKAASKSRQLTSRSFTHGTPHGYSVGCRCRKCKAARASSERYNRSRIQYRLSSCLRNRVYQAIRAHQAAKWRNTKELIGCDIDTFMVHLEAQFKPGMSFDNYGKWHIDHIIPCATFDLTKPTEQRKCFHYTNLQPLWAEDHIAKHRAVSRPVDSATMTR